MLSGAFPLEKAAVAGDKIRSPSALLNIRVTRKRIANRNTILSKIFRMSFIFSPLNGIYYAQRSNLLNLAIATPMDAPKARISQNPA